jgi:hypothetical protein
VNGQKWLPRRRQKAKTRKEMKIMSRRNSHKNPNLPENFRIRKDFYEVRPGNSGEESMKGNKHMKTITIITYSAFALIALACFAFSPQAQAVCQDGCDNSLFNAFQGDNALINNTTGIENSAFGWGALSRDTDASFNTGVGGGALALNNGDDNTAIGAAALLLNTTGGLNVAVGTDAMVFNDSGNFNAAIGAFALRNNHTATGNTAVGTLALNANDVDGAGAAYGNSAVGVYALFSNIDGFRNSAFGGGALYQNRIASLNTAIGAEALGENDFDGSGLGNSNTAVGAAAMLNNADGMWNTVVGTFAGDNLVAGFNNTYVGYLVAALALDESNTIRIGDVSNEIGGSLECFIGGIFNNFQPVNGNNVVQVTLNLDDDHLGWDFGPNQGGTAPLQRSTPQRRSAPQPAAHPQSQHHAMNDKVEKLQATVAQQQKEIDALTAGLQKVSAQLELSKPEPQTVLNNR